MRMASVAGALLLGAFMLMAAGVFGPAGVTPRVQAQDGGDGIVWVDDLKTAIAQSEQDGRPLMVVFR